MQYLNFENLKATSKLVKIRNTDVLLKYLDPVICVESLRTKRCQPYTGLSFKELTRQLCPIETLLEFVESIKNDCESIFLSGYDQTMIDAVMCQLNIHPAHLQSKSLKWVDGELTGYFFDFKNSTKTNSKPDEILIFDDLNLILNNYRLDKTSKRGRISFDKKPPIDKNCMFFIGMC